MCAMTSEEKDLMKTWATENIAPIGGTNFDAAFATAFEALQSPKTSACNKAILFMTDGQSQVNYASVRQNAVAYGTRVMTYALGSGAQPDVCQQLACENGGVFTAVGDDDDLGLVMASYYKVFAAVSSPYLTFESALTNVNPHDLHLMLVSTWWHRACQGLTSAASRGPTTWVVSHLWSFCLPVCQFSKPSPAKLPVAAVPSRQVPPTPTHTPSCSALSAWT